LRFYQKALLPLLPNPWCYVQVNDKTLVFRTWGTTRYSIPLEDIRPNLTPHGLFSLFGYGSIVLDAGGRSYDAPNLLNARGLRKLIENHTSSLAAGSWHDRLDENDLQSESIIIPNAPSLLVYVMHGVRHGHHRRMWNDSPGPAVNTGDWVQSGDLVCNSGYGAKILSPCDGLVRQSNSKQFGWDERTGWTRAFSSGFQQRLGDMALTIIQPLQQTPVPSNYVQIAFKPFLDASRQAVQQLEVMPDEKFRNWFRKSFERGDDRPSDVRTKLVSEARAAIAMIEKATPHKIVGGRIEDLPEWPTKDWIAQNAPRSGVEWICDDPEATG